MHSIYLSVSRGRNEVFFAVKTLAQARLGVARGKINDNRSLFPKVHSRTLHFSSFVKKSPLSLSVFIIAEVFQKGKGRTKKSYDFLLCYFLTRKMKTLSNFPRAEDM